VTNGKIIAFGLLTERDLRALGPSFSRAWPVDEAPCFTQLLDAIDDADRLHRVPRPAASLQDHGSPTLEQNPIGTGRR
jgi:hypothetical protein